MKFHYPFTLDKGDSNSEIMSLLIYGDQFFPSDSSSDSSSDVDIVKKKSAFKKVKRSVDLPYEHFAFIQALVDINGGQFSFNTILILMIELVGSEFFHDCIDSTSFQNAYQALLIERLQDENKALYEMIQNSQDSRGDSDV